MKLKLYNLSFVLVQTYYFEEVSEGFVKSLFGYNWMRKICVPSYNIPMSSQDAKAFDWVLNINRNLCPRHKSFDKFSS